LSAKMKGIPMPKKIPKQKPPRSPRKKKRWLTLAIVLGFVGVFVALSLTVLFPISRCVVVGQTRYSAQQFADAMQLGEQNINLFRADIQALIAQAEQALPYANITGATRQPPNALRLYVEEHQPAFAQQQDNMWWLIAENGRLLEQVEAPPEDMLMLRGMELYEARPGQIAQWERAFTRTEDMGLLISALRESTLWPYVTGLRISTYTLPDIIYQDRVRIRLGSASPVGGTQEHNLRYMFLLAEQVLEHLNDQNPNYRGVLDLSVSGQTPFSPMWGGEWEP